MTESKEKAFYGNRLIFILFFIYCVQMGFALYSRAVLYPFMLDELGWARAQIMLGHTATSMLFGFASPLTAWLINRYGAKFTISLGAGIIIVSNTLMGLFAQTYPLYLLLSILNGFGLCFSSMLATQTIVIAWFNVRRSLALGLVLGGGSVGGFLFPQLVTAIVNAANGNWRLGWFVCALFSFLVLTINVLFTRNKPSDIGQYPDGLAPGAAAKNGAGQATTYRSPVNWKLRDAVRTPSLWLVILAAAGNLFLWHVMLSQGPFHLQDRGFDPYYASFFYSLAIGTSIVGRLAIGAIGDRIEPRYLFGLGIMFILFGGLAFWFASPQYLWLAYLYPILSGIGFGTAFLCRSLLISNYFGAGSFATISAFTNPIGSLITAFAPPLAGYLFDTTGTYFTILVFAWLLAIVGFTAALRCAPPRLPAEYSTTDAG